MLDKFNIGVRLSTTTRVGYHEYTFHKAGQGNIILDLNHRDELLEGEVKILDDKTIEVFRRSKSWAENQYIYSRIEFSKPMKLSKLNSEKGKTETNANTEVSDSKNISINGKKIALALTSEMKAGEKILVKVAISPVSYEGAAKSMLAEGKSNSFEEIKENAEKNWDKELSKIEVKTNDINKKTIFYTALYHVFTQPNIYQDVDGKYRGRDNKIHTAEGYNNYTVFSLWDTFRGAHPLMTLIDKKRTTDFIQTFIKQYEQGGKLPVWELAANETECMIGYHAVPVIADAMIKGIKGFDYEKAFEASKNSAMLNIFGLDAYKKNFYISVDDEHESVSKTLEYAYDDWCIAQMALLLNKTEDYAYFMKRAQSWKNVYNPKTGFMQARKNGSWLEPFEPSEVNNNYTEGNSWQYSFFVPQDVEGLIKAHGGDKKFEQFLDALFSAPEKTTGREQVDITGLIGQYAQGNEPSHHIAYLYNFVGKPEKTDAKIKFILDNFYKNEPDGLIGNEDCGQMSAWYILSSMGIYSVTPGLPEWQTTTPYFEEIKINFEDGTNKIITPQTPKSELRKLGFENIPNLKQKPYAELVQTPAIISDRIFDFHAKVKIDAMQLKDKLYYQTISEGKTEAFKPYKKPFTIDKTTIVNAYAERNGQKSSVGEATFNKRPNHWDIQVFSTFVPQYHNGGFQSLIDGIHGTANWRKGEWQGYQGQDFEAVIDMKTQREITEISSSYLQDSRSWILMPRKVEYFASSDNKDYFLVATVNNSISPEITESLTKDFDAKLLPTTARYIKVKAYQYGKLPAWHVGAGNPSYIFIDEITVK